MGNASKWFCGLVCDASDSHNSSFPIKSPNQKWRWSFLKSYEDNPQQWAAIKIQAAFRACLARRALRALKGLVMLQALVRAEIDRKRTAEFLQRMHPFSGAQARARAARACAAQAQFSQASWTAKPSSTSHIHGPATPDKFESPIRFVSMKFDHPSLVLKRNGSKSDNGVDEQSLNQPRSCSMDDERSVKTYEIYPRKPHITSQHRNLFYSTSQPLVLDHYSQSLTTTKDSTSYQSCQSPSSCKVQSYSPQNIPTSSKEGGSKRSPFTPTMSDGTRTYISGNSDNPSYMGYTQSSKAKVRSNSAPKQRPYYERSSSSNRHTLH